MNQFNIVAENFKTDIRRQSRHKIMAEKRQLFPFQCLPIDKVAASLHLPPKKTQLYETDQIIARAWHSLLYFTQNILQNRIKCEQERPRQNITMEGHINFWSMLVYQLYKQKYKPSALLYEFISKYILLNSHLNISVDEVYEMKVVNSLHLIISGGVPLTLKQSIIRWVTEISGIPLLLGCLQPQRYEHKQMVNMLMIVEKGLQIPSKKILMESIEILQRLISKAWRSDLIEIYNENYGIMSNLLVQSLRYIDSEEVQIFCNAILHLFPYSQNIILNYCKLGVVYLVSRLFETNFQLQLKKGLQILQFLTQFESNEIYDYLLANNQIQETGMWKIFDCRSSIYTHPNYEIRKLAFMVIYNILYKGEFEKVSVFISEIVSDRDDDIFSLFHFALKEEEDAVILLKILNSLSILLFYGQQYKEYNRNISAVKMAERAIDKQVQKLTVHECEKVAERASQLIEQIKYNLQ